VPRPARYAKGIAKREEILDTALEVIARSGYARASVRELADAVGLSQAGLLHYFASKEELYAAILLRRDQVDLARVNEVSPQLDAVRGIVRHNAEVPGLVQLYARYSVEATDPGHPAHADFVERYARIRRALAEDISTRVAAGTLPAATDPALLANILVAVMDGLQTQFLLEPGFDMAAHLDHLLSLLGTSPAGREPQ
jgi:AcrR family transcriptional regulator